MLCIKHLAIKLSVPDSVGIRIKESFSRTKEKYEQPYIIDNLCFDPTSSYKALSVTRSKINETRKRTT